MLLRKIFLFVGFFSTLTNYVLSQSLPSPEKEKKVKHHSPTAAIILSTCVPGLGQVYNKKYWKPPIIYAAIGTTIYFFNYNNKLYKDYKQEYISRTDKDLLTIPNEEYKAYNLTQLKELEDYHHRYRDLNVILTGLVYTINIVDAYVDAHLKTFDISDNLSMNIYPSLNLYALQKKPTAGLTFSLRF